MTAVVLAEPLTPEWYEQRRRGIGASEIAAVMGISPWESPFSLYWRKVNGWEQEPSAQMSAGQRLEPVIAEWWADECDPLENLTITTSPLVAHPERPWQLASPDRLVFMACPACGGSGLLGDLDGDGVYSCDECRDPSPPLAVLELKYVAQSWDGWGEPDSDDIPVHYRAQVLWQCDVVGVDSWYVAALGPGGFRQYRGRSDEKDLRVMREYGRRFMDRLEAGDTPPVDEHSATLAVLPRLYPELVDEQAVVDDRLAEGYLRATRMRRLAEQTEKRYEALIRDQIGPARTAVTASGRKVATHVIAEVAAEKQPRGPHRKDYLLAALPRKKNTP